MLPTAAVVKIPSCIFGGQTPDPSHTDDKHSLLARLISEVYGYGGKNAKRTVQESTTVCNETYKCTYYV